MDCHASLAMTSPAALLSMTGQGTDAVNLAVIVLSGCKRLHLGAQLDFSNQENPLWQLH
jgi:hypothetical protein